MPPYSRQPEQMSDQSTQFVSFYSYKGGVGRSTVLANLACWQAMQGRKVLIIDLDLEGPGQHSSGLFKGNPIHDSAITGGFVDLCEAWQHHHAQMPDKVYEWDLRDYMLRSTLLDTLPGTNKGEIFLMPAGKQLDTVYTQKLNRLDWHNFFSPNESKGYRLFDTLKLYCEIEEFDYVFIDSRTGLSDPYYMATSWLSDTVVCFSLLNRPSIEGCRYAMELIQTEDFQNKYGKKRVLPVLTIIPPTRNFEVNERIRAIQAEEWPEIEKNFVTQFRYDEALAIEEQILAVKDGFEESDFGKSLQKLNAAMKDSSDYLMSKDQACRNFRGTTLENPFRSLRVEYWRPREIAKYYSAIYPRIEEQLTGFQPVIIYGSRGTGKTTMARYFDYQTQLIVFQQNNQRMPKSGELPYLGLWIRQDGDFLKAFNVPDKDKQKDYNTLFGLFFDMVVLRKSLNAMQSFGGLSVWIKSTEELFWILRREIGVTSNGQCNVEVFLKHLDTRLYQIRAYINNPSRVEMPYLFQSNTLMKLLTEQLKVETVYLVVFVDEVENYASYQQRMLNTRVKHVKSSDAVTYKLLARNAGIKTMSTDSHNQELEATHDYRAFFLDEEITFQEFKERAEILVNRYISSFTQFQPIGKAQDFLEDLKSEEEAQKICGGSNKRLISHLGKQHHLREEHPLIRWMGNEPNLLRQAVATVMVNQGKNANVVATNMDENTSEAQAWYHNYSIGTLYWLCTLHKKTKTYSGFNNIAGIAGNNIRVVVDIFYAIFEEWIIKVEKEKRRLPFSSELQNKCISESSRTYFKKLDRFRPTEKQLNRLVERLGNLFAAIHKSPRQGEPEINHFSANGDLDEKTMEYLKLCLQENLLRCLPSTKQKSSSDYLPDAFQINPCFAPNFGISWRKKKKLSLKPDDVHKLCFGADNEWKKIHSRIERQYHGRSDNKSNQSQTRMYLDA